MLDLTKDREVLDAIVAEVASKQSAEANAKTTGKVKRQIIVDCLADTNGRAKVERFLARWMAFPPAAHTVRGGVATVSHAAAVEQLFGAQSEADAASEAMADAA